MARALLDRGYRVYLLVRNPAKVPSLSGAGLVYGDPMKPGEWQRLCAESQVVVNLAGESIFGRWSTSKKDRIWDSRVLTTRRVVECMGKGALLVNASAVGYYGMDRGEEELTEDSPPGGDFLARLCVAWEEEALKAQSRGVRVLLLRFGIVLGRGGALARMLPIFRLGLGGSLGSGNQWFPWVHIDDAVGALLFLLERELSGAFNLVSPGIVRQREFAKALGRALKRPAILPVPSGLLRLLFGEGAGVFTGSLRVVPERLLGAGYSFLYHQIEPALASLLP